MAIRAHGEGTIYRRKDGLFEGKLPLKSAEGRPVRKSFYGRTRTEVAARMREYRARNGNRVEPPRQTVASLLEQYLAASEVRPNTFRQRAHLIRKHIIPYIGALRLGEVTANHIRSLVQQWKDANVGAVTQRSAFVTLSSALNLAVREEMIVRNPCVTVQTPRSGARRLRFLMVARRCNS